eukprot:gene26003-biopygen12795
MQSKSEKVRNTSEARFSSIQLRLQLDSSTNTIVVSEGLSLKPIANLYTIDGRLIEYLEHIDHSTQ